MLIGAVLFVAACGGGDSEQATEDGAAPDGSDTTPTTGSDTTGTSESTTTTSGATTTSEATTTTESTTTTATDAPSDPGEVPASGNGVLTIDGVDIPFTINSCSDEPTLQQATGAIQIFTMRGLGMAEGREVFVNASTIEFAGRTNDTYGYSYADDPDDFETLVIVGTGGSQGDLFAVDGATFSAGPVPLQRVEGVSVVEDVDPGPGSIRFTC